MTDDSSSLWARLLARRQSALHGFFRRRVRHPWDAEDLAQEVCLRLLRAERNQFEAIRNPEAYLFTVAGNLVKERAALRQRAPLDLAASIEALAELPSSDRPAEDSADRETRCRRLAEVLDQLPPRCRVVLTMQYQHQMNYQQIAEHLGVSTHMVKKYVVKALALCRARLAHYR